MAAPGGDRERREDVASVSERVYRSLVRAYPEETRRRYGDEMARYFGDLCREEARSRGAKGLALLWARALPELAFTALRERGAMLPRNAYLPVSPFAAQRWGGLAALVGGVLGTTYFLTLDGIGGIGHDGSRPVQDLLFLLNLSVFFSALVLCAFGMFGLYGELATRSGRPGWMAVAGAVLAFASSASALALAALQAGLFYPLFSALGYPNNALGVANLFGWFFSLVLLGIAAARAGGPRRLRVLPLAVAAVWLASFGESALALPGDYGFGYGTVLVASMGMLSSGLPFLGSAILGWALLRGHDPVGGQPARLG